MAEANLDPVFQIQRVYLKDVSLEQPKVTWTLQFRSAEIPMAPCPVPYMYLLAAELPSLSVESALGRVT